MTKRVPLKNQLLFVGITPSKRFYVYFLCDPDSLDRPFYIGKGTKTRPLDHFYLPYNTWLKHGAQWRTDSTISAHKEREAIKLWEQGKKVAINIVYEHDDEMMTYYEEARLITMYRAKGLLCQADGGFGRLASEYRRLKSAAGEGEDV